MIDKPSKTQRKRDMEALQALGETLLEFNPKTLEPLDLPEDLMKALKEARRLSSGKPERRQNQYIGKLMRDLDEETLAGIRRYLAQRGK